jgi:hypothetical protein
MDAMSTRAARAAGIARAIGIAVLASLGRGVAIAEGSWPEVSDPSGHEQFVCVSSSNRRLISIYRIDDHRARGCRVDYTRDGKTRTLWSAVHDYPYCVRKALTLVGKLSKEKFNCTPQTEPAQPSASP